MTKPFKTKTKTKTTAFKTKTKTKTRRFKTKTKTKTWPLPTMLTQRLKDTDTNTIIPNLYPVT